MFRNDKENKKGSQKPRPANLRDSVEEMMAIMTDENGDLQKPDTSRRKRRDTYERIMGMLSPEERAEAKAFLENYVEYLQHRHEFAQKRRKPRS